MIKVDVSRYLNVAVTMAVIAVTMVRVIQVMKKEHDCQITVRCTGVISNIQTVLLW